MPEEQIKPKEIIRVLGDLRGGLVATDASQQLERLVQAVMEAGKKGTISIQLTLDPHGKDNREIHVTAKVTSKVPQAPGLNERSIFFGQRGQLLRHDPGEQGDMLGEGEGRRQLRTVPAQ